MTTPEPINPASVDPIHRLDQAHAAATKKINALVSEAADGIAQHGPESIAAQLAGTALATDHESVAHLLAAAIVKLALYEYRDRRRTPEGADDNDPQRMG